MSVATVDSKHNVTGNRQAYYDKISKKDLREQFRDYRLPGT